MDTDLTKFQHVQNRLARVGTKSPPSTHSVPLLRSLHWLPVKFSILFKISLLIYKTPHEKQPVYLHSTLAPSIPSCSLTSSRGISLSVPRGQDHHRRRSFSRLCPVSLEQPPAVCSFSHFSCHLQETSQGTSL